MGNIKNILSLILFCTFFISYIMKLVILYKKDKIKANVLVKGHKISAIKYTEIFVKTTTLIWGATWFILALKEPFIVNILGILFDNTVVNLIGTGLTGLGCFIFIQAMVSMRTSWRVGIDKTTKTKLITHGIYKYSRNPAFVGFDFMFIGLFLMYPNLLTLIIFILNILAIHLLILQEEKHLKSMFGDEYIQYYNKTSRYILFF
jgi:protein-S-isoprenylcysteine O-methyltransferase Ste14